MHVYVSVHRCLCAHMCICMYPVYVNPSVCTYMHKCAVDLGTVSLQYVGVWSGDLWVQQRFYMWVWPAVRTPGCSQMLAPLLLHSQFALALLPPHSLFSPLSALLLRHTVLAGIAHDFRPASKVLNSPLWPCLAHSGGPALHLH